jgi:hypothetical protein
MKWGQAVNPADLMRGDVMVKHNGRNPGETGGHVGFATGQTRMGENGLEMQMLSGNSSNQVQHDWYRADQLSIRRAMEQQTAASGLAGGMPGMPGMAPQAPMTPMPAANPFAQNPMGGLPGASAMPGYGAMPGMGATGGQMDMTGLADSFKAEMTPAFQTVATQIPQQFDPAMSQVAQVLPQKITDQGDFFGQQLLSAAQPGNTQAAQDNSQKYMQANSQIASDFQAKMAGASGGAGGMGAMGGAGGGGGLGSLLGMMGPLMGSFFAVGGTPGSSGGSRRPLSTILGDPDAEPIVAHRGELITPAHEVDRMRRMGRDAMLLDNAAVRDSNRRGSSSDETNAGTPGVATRTAAPRPIVNFNITTKDADSFRASQSQIHAKAAGAAYRDAARNN